MRTEIPSFAIADFVLGMMQCWDMMAVPKVLDGGVESILPCFLRFITGIWIQDRIVDKWSRVLEGSVESTLPQVWFKVLALGRSITGNGSLDRSD